MHMFNELTPPPPFPGAYHRWIRSTEGHRASSCKAAKNYSCQSDEIKGRIGDWSHQEKKLQHQRHVREVGSCWNSFGLKAVEMININTAQTNLLISNAGIMCVRDYTHSVDRYELQFASIHLGYFLLIDLLTEKLLAAANRARAVKCVKWWI